MAQILEKDIKQQICKRDTKANPKITIWINNDYR